MPSPLDLDQLRTFVAIADSGSFTRAGDAVAKTQSAVSMQMRRLEERIGRPIFVRDGRQSKLTEEGEKLLGYARRMVRLSDEALAAFDDNELIGRVRLGTPDDYADRFLPEILARFRRSNPRVEVVVDCQPTEHLSTMIREGNLDLAIITYCRGGGMGEVIREEPLLWVGSAQHGCEYQDPLPLALGRPTCDWRRTALDALGKAGRAHQVLYTSWSATAIAASVMTGLAITVMPESALRPGMRVLGEADGFPRLPMCEIGLVKTWLKPTTPIIQALAEHIVSSLDNLSVPAVAAE